MCNTLAGNSSEVKHGRRLIIDGLNLLDIMVSLFSYNWMESISENVKSFLLYLIFSEHESHKMLFDLYWAFHLYWTYNRTFNKGTKKCQLCKSKEFLYISGSCLHYMIRCKVRILSMSKHQRLHLSSKFLAHSRFQNLKGFFLQLISNSTKKNSVFNQL